MCGILGSIGPKNHFDPSALQTISHRGPDDQGYIREPDVFLGQTRLSIVDLSSNGHQPMVSADGRWVLIFNGEIYNHLDIRKELLAKGRKFKSTSDTETLLYAFAEYGPAILKRLNGIFAFAIYDKKARKIFIARDHFGVKPLYYYQQGNNFAFGSELKSLLKFPGLDKSLDANALLYYIQLFYGPGEMTPFRFIRKLMPGTFLTIELNTYRVVNQRYYQIAFNPDESHDEDYWIDKVDETLNKAVERQLMSDVPVGFFLSGGLDSGLIAAIAKKSMKGQQLNCYTISTGAEMEREGFSNDEFYARSIAKDLDLNLKVIPSELNMLRDFDKMIWQLDEPMTDPAPLHVLNISRQAREDGIKVLLGGTAGDDIFSGYRRHQALDLEKWITLLPTTLRKQTSRISNFMPGQGPATRRLKKVLGEIGKSQNDRIAGYFMWIQDKQAIDLFNSAYQFQLINEEKPADFYSHIVNSFPESTDILNKMLFLEMSGFLPDHNLNYTDKMSMAVGVESRVPFLDLNLAELAFSLPIKYKMRGSTTKYILKKVGERYLSNDVIYRPKTGFGAPVRTWINGLMKPLVDEKLSRERIAARGIFDPLAVRKMIEDNMNGKVDASYTIWSLLAIESWMEQFCD